MTLRKPGRTKAAHHKLDRRTAAQPEAAASLAEHRIVRPPEFQILLGYKTRQGLWRAIERGDVPQPLKHQKTRRVLGWTEKVVRGVLDGSTAA